MGMVADELPRSGRPRVQEDVRPAELRPAAARRAQRDSPIASPLLDVRFFVTAVLIQRDTGGNLSEILDNLAHVVRERFKIQRQVRVHTAHGRFTGYDAAGAAGGAGGGADRSSTPTHMGLLLHERMGQMMVMGAIVMQTIGFFWIRKVIKIEV